MRGVRVKSWGGRWRGRSGLAKVDLYTRGTIYVLVWTGSLTAAALMFSPDVQAAAAWPLIALGVALALGEGFLCARLARRAMDAYLGIGRVPRPLLWWSAGAAGALLVFQCALAMAAGMPGILATLPMLLSVTVLPVTAVLALLVRNRNTALCHLALLPAVYGLVSLTPMSAGDRLFTAVFITVVSGWMAATGRVSMWMLAVMWELREARDVQARLAVAEERLRFGRDLHDVLGRNLAVVALKSELAVRLARRGRPEAVDQMLEVQRIAQDSQREVREVVRGYREADLRIELEGARGVLEAAGITCTVVVGEVELPGDVQSALGWVVREAATNVLRHGDARRCTISVGELAGSARLVVENDGAGAADEGSGTGSGADRGRPGSGLAGLRERLSAVGGELEAGPGRDGRFRLSARVPLGAVVPLGREPGASGVPGAAPGGGSSRTADGTPRTAGTPPRTGGTGRTVDAARTGGTPRTVDAPGATAGSRPDSGSAA
ncbi:sensor histidine kinase [Streptomyces sp. NPDC000594]|uniref:sensor histidine kinase n=1 Tax=Streptomyces sp. NPDC000594 TaxID=3154261 RepID=UPI003334978D